MSKAPETLSLVEESALLAELTHRRYRGRAGLKATRNKLIALLMLDAGLRVGEVMLRHTFATKLMRKVPTRVVQELLGHKNLSSTQIYQHPNQGDKEAAIKTLGE